MKAKSNLRSQCSQALCVGVQVLLLASISWNNSIGRVRGATMYICRVCGKECETREELGGHVSGHSRKGTWRKEPNYCVVCGGKTSRRESKFCSNKCHQEYMAKEWDAKWYAGELNEHLAADTPYWTNKRVRSALFRKYNGQCAKCGWGEINPYTGRIPLEVEHIDGNYKNNTPENVTLLCPNCHSLTSTYKGANKGNGRKERKTLL